MLLDLFSISRHLSRLFRTDRVNILAHGKNFLLALRQKKIFYIDLETNSITNTLKLETTRNILFDSSIYVNDQVIFGDYGLNKRNKIYKSNNQGRSWEVAYQFSANEFKQILKLSGINMKRIFGYCVVMKWEKQNLLYLIKILIS